MRTALASEARTWAQDEPLWAWMRAQGRDLVWLARAMKRPGVDAGEQRIRLYRIRQGLTAWWHCEVEAVLRGTGQPFAALFTLQVPMKTCMAACRTCTRFRGTARDTYRPARVRRQDRIQADHTPHATPEGLEYPAAMPQTRRGSTNAPIPLRATR